MRRLKQVQQPPAVAGGPRPTIGYGYDGLDQLLTVTDPRSLTTTYTMTGLAENTALASPDTGITGMTYDAAGNLKTRLDARGKTVTYSYDALNRLTLIDYPSGTDTAFVYDDPAVAYSKGRLTRMTDESGSTDFGYDGFGRLTQKTQTVGSGAAAKTLSVRYAYGATGPSTGKLTAIT